MRLQQTHTLGLTLFHKQLMSAALPFAALWIGFFALSSYFLSQLWFGEFWITSSTVGVAGLATSWGGFILSKRPSAAPAWIKWVSLAAGFGFIAHTANRYANLSLDSRDDYLGDYLGLSLGGSYLACSGLIGITAARRTLRLSREV